jgi:ATP-dependent DNA helicase RecQ
VSAREVESALRVLAGADVLRTESESPSRVLVRLLATPERIKRELGGDPMSLELLRALWRVAGRQLETGTVVDLDTLPRARRRPGALPVLEGAAGRQFVVVERAGGGMRLADPRRPLADAPWTGRARPPAPFRGRQARCDAEVRLPLIVPAHVRAALLRRPGRAHGELRRMRQLPRRQAYDRRVRGAEGGAACACGALRRRGWRLRRVALAGGRAGAATPSLDPTELVLSAADERLFTTLKTLRGEIARAESMPAYIVFPDRTLAEFAVRRPRTLAAMGEVRGVGPAKLEKYGQRFLDALRGSAGGAPLAPPRRAAVPAGAGAGLRRAYGVAAAAGGRPHIPPHETGARAPHPWTTASTSPTSTSPCATWSAASPRARSRPSRPTTTRSRSSPGRTSSAWASSASSACRGPRRWAAPGWT